VQCREDFLAAPSFGHDFSRTIIWLPKSRIDAANWCSVARNLMECLAAQITRLMREALSICSASFNTHRGSPPVGTQQCDLYLEWTRFRNRSPHAALRTRGEPSGEGATALPQDRETPTSSPAAVGEGCDLVWVTCSPAQLVTQRSGRAATSAGGAPRGAGAQPSHSGRAGRRTRGPESLSRRRRRHAELSTCCSLGLTADMGCP
jgi:hypothetical protein